MCPDAFWLIAFGSCVVGIRTIVASPFVSPHFTGLAHGLVTDLSFGSWLLIHRIRFSVFVCKYKHVGHGMRKELDILRVLAIADDFSITNMTQIRPGTIDSNAMASRPALNQPAGWVSLRT